MGFCTREDACLGDEEELHVDDDLHMEGNHEERAASGDVDVLLKLKRRMHLL